MIKYYDLAKHGDGLAREHYAALSRTASDCNNCGECEPRCPFHVKVRERMQEIAAIITHVAFYVGWPKGWAVFNLAKEVWQAGEQAAVNAKLKKLLAIM